MKLVLTRILFLLYISLDWLFLLSSAESEYHSVETFFEKASSLTVFSVIYIPPLIITFFLLTIFFNRKSPNELLFLTVSVIVLMIVLFLISDVIFSPVKNYTLAAILLSVVSLILADFISKKWVLQINPSK